jgi:hypothetical protein
VPAGTCLTDGGADQPSAPWTCEACGTRQDRFAYRQAGLVCWQKSVTVSQSWHHQSATPRRFSWRRSGSKTAAHMPDLTTATERTHPMSTTTTTESVVWILCLACYNDGRLIGERFAAEGAGDITGQVAVTRGDVVPGCDRRGDGVTLPLVDLCQTSRSAMRASPGGGV